LFLVKPIRLEYRNELIVTSEIISDLKIPVEFRIEFYSSLYKYQCFEFCGQAVLTVRFSQPLVETQNFSQKAASRKFI